MAKVLALDQATTTGYCLASSSLPLEKWKTGHFRAPKRDIDGERFVLIEDTVIALAKDWEPDFIAYELPYDPTHEMMQRAAAGKPVRAQYNQKTMRFLRGVEVALEMAATRLVLPLEAYTPKAWRATLKLPGITPQIWETFRDMTDAGRQAMRTKTIKQQTILAVRRLGGQIQTNDEADAWGIAFHALHGQPGIKRATGDLFERAKGLV
jgi:hypothetical protein